MASMGVAGATIASNVVTAPRLSLGNKSCSSRAVRVSNVFASDSTTFSSVRVSNFFSSASLTFSSQFVTGTPNALDPTKLRKNFKAKATFGRPVTSIRAAIAVGDKLPEATLSCIVPTKEKSDYTTIGTTTISALTAGKKVILVGVPGAFLPSSTLRHLPGFVEMAEKFKEKGIDTVICIAANDVEVLKAWGEELGVRKEVLFFSDGNAEFAKAIGVAVNLPGAMGVRSRRYAMYVRDGVVEAFNLEKGGAATVSASTAEEILKAL